jgi:hypothetical protein
LATGRFLVTAEQLVVPLASGGCGCLQDRAALHQQHGVISFPAVSIQTRNSNPENNKSNAWRVLLRAGLGCAAPAAWPELISGHEGWSGA